MSKHETPPNDMSAEQAAKRAADSASVAITYAADAAGAIPGTYSDAAERKANAFSGAADALAQVAWWAAVAANLADKADLVHTAAKIQGNLFRLRMAGSNAALAEHYAADAEDSFIQALDAIHAATT